MTPQLPLLTLPLAPSVQCRICGANLRGVLHRDTAGGPECLVCPPAALRRSWQATLDFEPSRMAEAQGLGEGA